MGYALWLVPSSTEFTALSELMKFRPQPYTLDSHSRSYPSFDPHITLATFDVLPSSFNLDAIPLDNLSLPVASFDSVKYGNNYLGALSIRISQSSKLMRLHEAVTRHLNTLNIQWKSRGFPHMSLFYVDEPDERKRLEAELKSSGRIQSHDGGRCLKLTANPTSVRSTQVKTFTGAEIWLVDCTSRSVKQWCVMKKRSLVIPAPPPPPPKTVPKKQTAVHATRHKGRAHPGYLAVPPKPRHHRRQRTSPNRHGCLAVILRWWQGRP